MSTPNESHEYEAFDTPIEPPDEKDFEYEAIPTGAYVGKLLGFRQVATPPWKIISQQANKPEKTPDPLQWEWTFQITDGEFADATISNWTSRSWHSRSSAAATACALLGQPQLPRGSGLSTKQLIGRPCQIWVVEKPKDDGSTRSYVDKVLPIPQRRQRAATAPTEPVAAVPAPQPAMAGGSDDGGDEEGYWASVSKDAPEPE